MVTPADGTITFTLFGPNNCTSVPTGFVPIVVNVNGDGTYTASFTPTQIGTFTWVAVYSGDSPNTLGAGPTSCPDVNEEVVVTGQSALSTAQDWLPNDTATITGPTNLNGTLTFTLYTGADCAYLGYAGSRAVLQRHARERAFAGDSDHGEHDVQGHGREPRCLLVARALRRHHPDRSSRQVRDVDGLHH